MSECIRGKASQAHTRSQLQHAREAVDALVRQHNGPPHSTSSIQGAHRARTATILFGTAVQAVQGSEILQVLKFQVLRAAPHGLRSLAWPWRNGALSRTCAVRMDLTELTASPVPKHCLPHITCCCPARPNDAQVMIGRASEWGVDFELMDDERI